MRVRPFFATLALSVASLIVAGCGIKAPVSGFAPVSPEVTFSAPGLDWTKIDSLQPTFRWEPFPGTHQTGWNDEIKPFIVVDLNSVEHVTYELRIWIVAEGIPRDLVYERQGLTEPSHRLEQPLAPDTEYFWSVRARFTVNGQPKATEWSLSQLPCPPAYGLGCARGMARSSGMIPPRNHYRFKTPPR